MGVTNLGRSEPGLFGLWNLLAIIEEIAIVALMGRRIDDAVLESRLGIFLSDAQFWALQSTRVLLLVAGEVRDLIDDEVDHAAHAPPPWPPEGMDIEEEAALLVAAGEAFTLMPDDAAFTRETNATSRDLVRQTLGFLAGAVTLSEHASPGSDTALVELFGGLLSTIQGEQRRRLHAAADLVFWAAAFLVANLERHFESERGRVGMDDPDAPEHHL